MKNNTVVSRIISDYSTHEILYICKVLNKSYNIYDTEEARWGKISYALFKSSKQHIDELKSVMYSNQFINDLIFQHYACERVIKYYFIQKLKNQKNHVIAFEMSVADSRVDICRINGESFAYEIKTEYDSFDRLESQIKDYANTFDKVYVIIPKMRINEIKEVLPNSCGIILYRTGKNNQLVFSYFRKAEKNKCDPSVCIRSLSSHDLSIMLRMLSLEDHNTKEAKEKSLIEYSSNHSIWKAYKQFLKQKYEPQWSFLIQHFEEILPIDVQTFFSTSLSPHLFSQAKKA